MQKDTEKYFIPQKHFKNSVVLSYNLQCDIILTGMELSVTKKAYPFSYFYLLFE